MSLEIRNCHYHHEQIVFAIDGLLLAAGIHLLWGVSGSGKTTFIEGLCGKRRGFWPLICKDTEFFFFKSLKEREDFFARFISVHYQSEDLIDELDVQANLFLPSALNGRIKPSGEAVDRELQIFELEPLLARKPSSLSGGERQRVSVCRAMLYARDLLLLDEPFVFMEKELQEKIFRHIVDRVQAEDIICLLSSHEPWLEKSLPENKINLVSGLRFPPGRPV
jgi:molybdate transport system ATP-binding protein